MHILTFYGLISGYVRVLVCVPYLLMLVLLTVAGTNGEELSGASEGGMSNSIIIASI